MVALLALVAAGVMAQSGHGWGGAGFGLIALAGLSFVVRCPHPGPLGLLPPVIDETGKRLPARWYCDACGREWSASIEVGHAPIQKFTGFDQTKAILAAQRAADLEMRQRSLAMRRAGISQVTPKARHASSGTGSSRRGPVPIDEHRRTG